MYVALLFVLCSVAATNVQDEAIVSHINSQNAGWTAALYPQFKSLSLQDAAKLGGLLPPVNIPSPSTRKRAQPRHVLDAIPVEFDARKKWATCAPPIRTQGDCGACWAFSSTSAFDYRLCIATNGTTNIVSSIQNPIDCIGPWNGCNGGQNYDIYTYFNSGYSVPDDDYPYTFSKTTCQIASKTNASRYHSTGYKVLYTDEDTQLEIMNNGPVVIAFYLYQDFYSYKSGVYTHTWGDNAGGHAVYVTGWGVENGTKFWYAVNSWGENWGENGGFRMKRGNDECGMNSVWSPVAGFAQVPNITTTATPAVASVPETITMPSCSATRNTTISVAFDDILVGIYVNGVLLSGLNGSDWSKSFTFTNIEAGPNDWITIAGKNKGIYSPTDNQVGILADITFTSVTGARVVVSTKPSSSWICLSTANPPSEQWMSTAATSIYPTISLGANKIGGSPNVNYLKESYANISSSAEFIWVKPASSPIVYCKVKLPGPSCVTNRTAAPVNSTFNYHLQTSASSHVGIYWFNIVAFSIFIIYMIQIL